MKYYLADHGLTNHSLTHAFLCLSINKVIFQAQRKVMWQRVPT